MNPFLTALIDSARRGDAGMRTGDPAALTRTTWTEVHARARRIAGGLIRAGLRPGGAVAVLAGAPADIAPVVQGVWLAGGTVTMLHQPTPRADLAQWAADTRRALAVIDARLVVLGDPFEAVADGALPGVECVTVERLGAGPDLEPVPTRAEDPAFLQLTSGSTGAPKAVIISYANMYANIRAMEFASLINLRRDVMVSWLPLFHDMGMMGFLVAPMFLGVELISVTPADFLASPPVWARLIGEHRGTMTAAPNFAYGLLARTLERAADGAYDLSTLRFALNGAEPVDQAVAQRFLAAGARFGLRPQALVPAYGMAEATLAVSFVRPGSGLSVEADGQVRLGPPLPGIDVRVRAESGALAATGEVGEIEVRGESITRGYRTADGVLDALDDSGWLATGDLGYRTGDRQIVVCGRKKDVLIVSGRNLYPVDVERLAAGVDGVRAGNAVAVRTGGETFAVLVESAASGDPTERERIAREVAHRVQAGLGVGPRRVEVVAPGRLPKTPSGKPRRIDAAALLTGDPIRC
ncbi:fatty-acyl-CoA synthase [Nocardia pseudobrasiliensis]|uniref:Fatty-acyl-CoA synthase n=2 Tax=Nocardia pseudobrasiliensis TaxID=45979 RepID=A0A370HSK0_9NOCA|nr:fatty acyl-AMP ligase [Nocardia pseudobrasiliensis]RDI61305.1 fatty-acyl-CoA synthase [Nocardia pseudobrasiliensis]